MGGEANSNDSKSPQKYGMRSNSRTKLIGNKKIMEVQEELESTNKFQREYEERRDSTLPDIQRSKN